MLQYSTKGYLPSLIVILFLSVIYIPNNLQVYADPINMSVYSTFDIGLDEWTFFNENGHQIMWSATEGNPPGALLFNDIVDVESGTIVEPSKFLGDWSAFNQNGLISFDHRLIDAGCNPTL